MSANAGFTETDARRVLLVSDQTRDGLVQAALGEAVTMRLLYQRCHEARAQDLPGQDYARVLGMPNGVSLSLCVCDGVGSSYKGDFAARYVAIRLVDWLDELESLPSETQTFTQQLARQLGQWALEAQAELRARAIPAGITEVVREVLEDLRDEFGSEAVFFAGRIDRPPGASAARAVFCWMGNISAYLFTSATEGVYIRPADDAVRWSTGRGMRGIPGVRLFALDGLKRLLIHTDGCDSLSADLPFLSDDDLRARCEAELATPASDDMTILDIRWVMGAGPGGLERDTPVG